MPPKEFLPSAKVARLSYSNLICALDAWGVEYSSSDRELPLRAKLDEAIAAAIEKKKGKHCGGASGETAPSKAAEPPSILVGENNGFCNKLCGSHSKSLA